MEELTPSLDQIIAFWNATWAGWLVCALVIAGGQVSKAIAAAMGWRGEHRIYDLTLRAQPIIAGFLFGFVPFPTFSAIDTLHPTGALVLVRCLYFAGWGCISGQIFELGKFGKKWVKKWLEMKTGVRVTNVPSDPPPAGDPSSSDAT